MSCGRITHYDTDILTIQTSNIKHKNDELQTTKQPPKQEAKLLTKNWTRQWLDFDLTILTGRFIFYKS